MFYFFRHAGQKKDIKIITVLGLLATVFIVVMVLIPIFKVSREETPAPAIGLKKAEEVKPTARNFEFSDFSGQKQTLEEVRNGRPVILTFFASWCESCRAALTDIQKISQESANRGYQVLAVHMTNTENPARALSFIKDSGINLPLAEDVKGDIFNLYAKNKRLLPLTVLIDQKGVVQYTKHGQVNSDELRQVLAKNR
ncbi:MAG: TlpA disulfide reductase family protein [bacterium]|nr:TlpA disulfide reductase family protein [bacterium]